MRSDNRLRTCEHMMACVTERGLAIDGGELPSCDQSPCDECGALCPGSTWTPESSVESLDYRQDMLNRARNENAERILRYLVWKESR